MPGGAPIIAATKGIHLAGRVVFVLTNLQYAGAQMQVLALAERLKARGWWTGVISMIAPEALEPELEEAGIAWASLDMARGSSGVRPILLLRRILREWRPDVLHSHMVHANLLARVTRVVAPVPVLISTAHNIDEGGRARMLGYRLTDPLSEHTTNVSAAAVRRYVRIRAVPERKISFVPNGIDAERFRPRPGVRERLRGELGLGDDEFAWLAVGRLEEQKDLPNMLRAVARAAASRPGTRLLLVGEGALEDEVGRERARLGLEGSVSLLGRRADVPDLLGAVDGYLMSSAWEGMPIVLLEAAAAGLPIAATDVGGNAEVVRSGETGLLVPPRDDGALAAAMIRVMDMSPRERRAMGGRGRAFVAETYDLEAVVDRWEALYLEWLGRTGGRRLSLKPA